MQGTVCMSFIEGDSMLTPRPCIALRLIALFLIGSAITYGQTGLATLTGLIADPSGAVMANVAVNALHVETGANTVGTTSATGNYTIPQLQVGQYVVTVEQAGFKTFRREGLTLGATQILRLDVTMEVGATTESVTVTAEASLLKTESGTLVHNITPAQIQNLPLLRVGIFIRDPFALARTLPGVVGNADGVTPRINGLPAGSVQYRMEGEVLGQLGAPTITTRHQMSADAVEEVAVQTSNLTSEFGSATGAVFNVTLKSGQNAIHGTLSDYMINEVLNSNDPAVHRKNRVRRHDYTLNVGGPIRIPWLYNGRDKSFYFFNWEQYRDSQTLFTGFTIPTVPTQAYREGNFANLIPLSGTNGAPLNLRIGGTSPHDYLDPLGRPVVLGTIFDARTTRQVTCNTAISLDCGANGTSLSVRDPFPGNRVPTSLFDPVALAIQNKYIPLPQGPRHDNGEAIQNYYNPFGTARITRAPALKLDHNLSAKGRLSFSWTDNHTESAVQNGFGAEGFGPIITAGLGTYEASPNYRMNFDYTILPTMSLHVGTGWSTFNFSNAALTTNYNALQDIGLAGARHIRQFPRMNTTVVNTPPIGGTNVMGPAGQSESPERRPSATVSLTWIRSNHTLKFGADFRQDMLTTRTFNNTAGTFNFSSTGITWQNSLIGVGGTTGNTNNGFGYANFLMGSVNSATLSTPIIFRRSKQQWGLYLQDTWRARRNLTIDYGLRWDYGTYTAEDYGRVANQSLTEPNPSAGGRAGALIYEATCKCQFADNYPYAIGPRLGVAYTLNPKTVIRGGFGIAYGSIGTVSGAAQNSVDTSAIQAGEESFKLRNGIPSEVNPQWPVYDAGLGHIPGQVRGAFTLVDPNAGRPDRTYQWNISLQRELNRDLVVEVSYVANRNLWQSTGGFQDFNAVSEQSLKHYGFTVGNTADAALLQKPWAQLTTAERSTLTSRGVGRPYSNFPITGTTGQTVFQSLRPFPQYNSGISPSAPIGRSWYDSLQITVNKRYSNGLQVNANYTFSKNLQHTSAFDVFNRANGKDIVGANPPQLLRISFEYQTPRPEAGIPVIGNRWVSQIIGGWGLSAALFYQTGGYLGRPGSGAATPISQWLGRGPGSGQLKKNSDGSYMSPWSVDWVDNTGTRRTDPLDIDCRCFDPEKTIVLNPNAWEQVPSGQWAEQTQTLPFFRASRRPTESANLARNFRFGNEGRFTFHIRIELQNVFNRVFLPSPSLGGLTYNPTTGNTGTYTPTADGRYTAGFGTFGNLRNANALGGIGNVGAQRAGQLVARFSF